jgi:hypothetical protein
MQVHRKSALIAITFAATLGACSDPLDSGRAPAVQFLGVDASAGPITRTVEVVLSAPGRVAVTWGAAGTPVLTLDSDSVTRQHRIPLPRLRANRQYVLEVIPKGDPNGSPVVSSFSTGALPANVAALGFTVTGTPTLPVAITEVVAGGFLGMLIVEDGEIVGFQPTQGSLFGTTRRANGDIVLLDPSLGLVAYRLDGTIPYRLPQPDSAPGAPYGRIHHDVIATPRNTILFIANETRAIAGQNVTGEALWEWTPETNTVVKRFSAFDHLRWPEEQTSRSDPTNWLHGNGLANGPAGNVIVSFRNIDQVISIAPDFSRVEWRMGGPGATVAQPIEERFAGQHGIVATAPDRVLLFDNGFGRTPAFSRAIEYRINTAAGTATRVWEYRTTPDIYAALVGSTRRLDNGNTVILFGMFQGHSGSTGPVMAVEVDAAGNERWRLAAGSNITRLYRLTPVASLLGERPGSFAN